MRRYITEKVGILECFQIILMTVAIGLSFYALSVDIKWNKRVDEEGMNVCIKINRELSKRNKSILLDSECTERLDIKDNTACENYLQKHYLTLKTKAENNRITLNGKSKDMRKFISTNMRRKQASEDSCIVAINMIAIMTITHVIVTSLVSSIELRTKWNAALQGIVCFSCGFSAMLLAVAVNTIDNKYINVANQLQICGLLRFCDRIQTSHPELKKEAEVIINGVLTNFDACQEVDLKKSICIILILVIGTCIAMVFLAMDLTTKYEQSEEQEIIQQETQENLENILHDEAVLWENPTASETSNVNPIIEESHIASGVSSTPGLQHLKTGSTVIAEYLAVNRPH